MRGIVFACSGISRLRETILSAQSAHQYMPEMPRVLFATLETLESIQDGLGIFTSVHRLTSTVHHHRPRFEAMLNSPFDEALFIDGDTLFLDNVSELFSVLESFDIGLSFAPQRFHPIAVRESIYNLLPSVSIALPEWNSGVIVARRSAEFHSFVKTWIEFLTITRSASYDMDQPALRAALCHSKLRVATLPNNYNYRGIFPQSVVGKIKILHAHGDLHLLATIVNQSHNNRYLGEEIRQFCSLHPKAE